MTGERRAAASAAVPDSPPPAALGAQDIGLFCRLARTRTAAAAAAQQQQQPCPVKDFYVDVTIRGVDVYLVRLADEESKTLVTTGKPFKQTASISFCKNRVPMNRIGGTRKRPLHCTSCEMNFSSCNGDVHSMCGQAHFRCVVCSLEVTNMGGIKKHCKTKNHQILKETWTRAHEESPKETKM